MIRELVDKMTASWLVPKYKINIDLSYPGNIWLRLIKVLTWKMLKSKRFLIQVWVKNKYKASTYLPYVFLFENLMLNCWRQTWKFSLPPGNNSNMQLRDRPGALMKEDLADTTFQTVPLCSLPRFSLYLKSPLAILKYRMGERYSFLL